MSKSGAAAEVWEGFKDRVRWLTSRSGWRGLSRGQRLAALVGAVVLACLAIALMATWDDIMRTGLDPKTPFQTYTPPKAPDYSQLAAWALNPALPGQRLQTGPVDVFFVHPTTFNGGRDWNGAIDDKSAARQLDRIMLPNYAGPFARVGRLYAPRYRQASLYAYQMTLREDARDARRFAYADVLAAFRAYLAHDNLGRPFILVGVEQGGLIADRLLHDEIAPNPALSKRLVAAYLIDVVTPAAGYGVQAPIPKCAARAQLHCVVSYMAVDQSDPNRAREAVSRALVWTPDGQLEDIGNQPPLCVNPLLGAASEQAAPARLNLGAVNASELEWGARAAFMPRQVSAQCVRGILLVSHPRSASLRPSGRWPDKFKEAPYNPFFADLEADAMKRVATYYGRADFPQGAPPIDQSTPVDSAPVHKVD
jgi:hypothetical protein